MTETREQLAEPATAMQILLIDDNPDDRDHFRRLLLAGFPRGLNVIEASTGERGIDAFSEVDPIHCVLLDMHLPDMSGLDVLEAVRDHHGDVLWPVVVLTGSMGEGEPSSVLRAGAQDFASKSWVSAESLTRAIENAIERHTLMHELRSSEERLRLALAAANMGTWEWDLASDRVLWSDGHFRILGYEPGEFEPTYAHWRSRVHPEDLSLVEAALREARERGGAYQCEYRVVWPDGSVRWTQARGRYLLGAGRAARRMHGIMHDITESRLVAEALSRLNAELETKIAERTVQLVEAQKLDAVGQITGTLAHDFNNLLAAIQGNLEVLRHRLATDPAGIKLVDGALQGAQRGGDLTRRLLSFVRRQDLQSRPADLRELVQGMDDLLRRAVGPMIEIRAEVAADLWLAVVDPNQFELSLLNLAVNARDAMSSGGTLTFRLHNETVRDSAPYPPELRPGDYVRVAVDDTGSGMDTATLTRATEPFFTTKVDGKGTGLGLASVHSLALQSGGALRLSSSPGIGTTVEMWIPRAAEAPASLPEPGLATRSDSPAAGKLNVLLVEDDFLIAMSTQAVLEDLGHRVRVAPSGGKALEQLAADPAIDIVITDHAMPGMTGVELAEHIRTAWPGMPILLATGYGHDGDGATTLPLPRIAKPYSQQQLAQAIRTVVGAPVVSPAAGPSLPRDGPPA